MGRGGYLAGRTEVEYYAVELAREHQEVRELPDVERREVKDLFLNKKPVVFQVLFGARNGGCSKNPRIQAWPNQKDHSGTIVG